MRTHRMTGAFLLWLAAGPAPGQIAEDAAWTVLDRGAANEHVVQRSQALAALSTLGTNPRAVRRVEAALADKDWSVRQAAVAALGQMQAKASVPKLQPLLKDEAPEVSFAAAKVLWDLGDRSGHDILLEILAGERRDSPGLVRTQLRDARSKLRNPAGLLLMGAKEGVGMVFGPASTGITVVEELMKDNAASARVVATTLLATDTDPSAGQELAGALEDHNWIVRAAAAKALGLHGDRALIPKLQGRLTDDREAVRYMAAASIVRLSAPPPKPPAPPKRRPAPAKVPAKAPGK
jgi:HEAT repeat protein